MRGHTNYERETDALAFGAQPIGRYSADCYRTIGNYYTKLKLRKTITILAVIILGFTVFLISLINSSVHN